MGSCLCVRGYVQQVQAVPVEARRGRQTSRRGSGMELSASTWMLKPEPLYLSKSVAFSYASTNQFKVKTVKTRTQVKTKE